MTDPICGMIVEPEQAAGSCAYKGQTYYFCSQHCLAKFKEDPDKFLKASPMGHTAHSQTQGPHRQMSPSDTRQVVGVAYVCPMDPDVRESKPGACPKCG